MGEDWLTGYFVAGGTLRLDTPSYVSRPADDELFRHASSGEFCYVLSSRQMGKSSLMVRAAIRLRDEGVVTAIVDLTKIGGTNININQWYLSLIVQIKRQLSIKERPEVWWAERAAISPVQRFINFLYDVVLAEIRGPVVIFIDEIDTTLSLDFADDFFAAIRSIYNDRAADGRYQRLTFVLIGVATPTDLIKDRSRTPFNIGRAINLQDFSHEDAVAVLQPGLQAAYPLYGELVFNRIFYWTNGHPYLTQKLCLYAAQVNLPHWTDARVDELVERLFLSEEAVRETNLQFVRDAMSVSFYRASLLRLYERVYEDEIVFDDERSLRQNQLKLIGLVRVEHGALKLRNEIYRRVFDLKWIQETMPPVDWSRRWVLILLSLLLLLGICVGGYVVQRNQQTTIAEEAQILVDSFRSSPEPVVRLKRLARLYNLIDQQTLANQLLAELSPEERIALFNLESPTEVEDDLIRVVKEMYVNPAYSEQTDLLAAMARPLRQLNSNNGIKLATEVDFLLRARGDFVNKNYDLALQNYTAALETNQDNPTTLFDRATTYLVLGQYRAALVDFERALALNQTWERPIRDIIQNNPQLYLTWWRSRTVYPDLTSVLPLPTNTATPTPTASATPTTTHTPSPTHTPTATQTPTNTATPTQTPIPTPTSTFTPTPTSTSSPTQTPTMTAMPTPTTLVPAFTPTIEVEIQATNSIPFPTFTPTPKPVQPAIIVYVQSSGARHDLGLVSWQGVLLQENLHRFAAAPAWSPDGVTIAFFGEEGINELGGIYSAGSGIWAITEGRDGVRRLSDLDHIVNMAWSPDNEKLVMEQKPPAFASAVVVINLADGQELGHFPGEQPTWRYDNQKLAAKACNPECGLWQFNIDGSEAERLTFDSTDSYPAWSPTGEILAFTSRARAGNWEIYLLRTGDKEPSRLTNRSGSDTTPVFSPDGQELYLRTDALDGTWRISAINLNTNEERLIQANVGPSDDWGKARPAVQNAK